MFFSRLYQKNSQISLFDTNTTFRRKSQFSAHFLPVASLASSCVSYRPRGYFREINITQLVRAVDEADTGSKSSILQDF